MHNHQLNKRCLRVLSGIFLGFLLVLSVSFDATTVSYPLFSHPLPTVIYAKGTEAKTGIKLPNGYKDALQSYVDLPSQENSDRLTRIGKKGIKQNPWEDYDGDEKVVNVTKLDTKTRTALSIYVAQLNNSVREQLGKPFVKVDDGAVALAQEFVNRLNQNNYNAFEKTQNGSGSPHDTADLKAIYVSKYQTGYKENMGESAPIVHPELSPNVKYFLANGDKPDEYGEKMRIKDIKHMIYADHIAMLFNDAHQHWGHTITMTRMGEGGEDQGFDDVVGFAVDQFGNFHYDYTDATADTFDHGKVYEAKPGEAIAVTDGKDAKAKPKAKGSTGGGIAGGPADDSFTVNGYGSLTRKAFDEQSQDIETALANQSPNGDFASGQKQSINEWLEDYHLSSSGTIIHYTHLGITLLGFILLGYDLFMTFSYVLDRVGIFEQSALGIVTFGRLETAMNDMDSNYLKVNAASSRHQQAKQVGVKDMVVINLLCVGLFVLIVTGTIYRMAYALYFAIFQFSQWVADAIHQGGVN